jgi:hypothetical protein
MGRRLTASLAGWALLALAAGSPLAFAHGGNEMAVEGLKMQPASTLAQQALAELRIRNDTEEAAVRLDAALESKDTSGIDMAVLMKATETLDHGNPQGAIPLIDEALSRPSGAKHGAALHEAGREFQPATGSQEIVGIIAGACLLLLGLLALHPWRRAAGT